MAESNHVDGYVHKLRLEARDGAYLALKPESLIVERKHPTAWIIAKFISLTVAFSSILMFAARELQS